MGNRQKAQEVLRAAAIVIDSAGHLSIHDEEKQLLKELS
jgi:tellurite resistance protein